MYTLTLTLQFTMQFLRDFLWKFENIKVLRAMLLNVFCPNPSRLNAVGWFSVKTHRKSVQNNQVIMETFLLQFPRLTHTLDVDRIVKLMSSWARKKYYLYFETSLSSPSDLSLLVYSNCEHESSITDISQDITCLFVHLLLIVCLFVILLSHSLFFNLLFVIHS